MKLKILLVILMVSMLLSGCGGGGGGSTGGGPSGVVATGGSASGPIDIGTGYVNPEPNIEPSNPPTGPVNVNPEPSSIALLSIGLTGLLLRSAKKKIRTKV